MDSDGQEKIIVIGNQGKSIDFEKKIVKIKQLII